MLNIIIILYQGSVNCDPQTKSISPAVFVLTWGYSSLFNDFGLK